MYYNSLNYITLHCKEISSLPLGILKQLLNNVHQQVLCKLELLYAFYRKLVFVMLMGIYLDRKDRFCSQISLN